LLLALRRWAKLGSERRAADIEKAFGDAGHRRGLRQISDAECCTHAVRGGWLFDVASEGAVACGQGPVSKLTRRNSVCIEKLDSLITTAAPRGARRAF
jgi:hypothetical protein